MNSEIVVAEDRPRASVFFDREPTVTDWDEVMRNAGSLVPAELIAAIKQEEPIDPGDMHKTYRVWVLNQKLRLALRAQQGLPLTTGVTCDVCLEHFGDPAHNEEGDHLRRALLGNCLWCLEYEKQMYAVYWGSRGSCEFTKAVYDIESRSWGLLSYDWRRDDPLMHWIALGWKSHREVELAVYPLVLFCSWARVRTEGVANSDISDMLPPSLTLRREGPCNPQQFRQMIHCQIEELMETVDNSSSHYVGRAIEQYDRAQRG